MERKLKHINHSIKNSTIKNNFFNFKLVHPLILVKRKHLILFSTALLYFCWVFFFVGLRPDHLFLIFIIIAGYIAHPFSKKMVLGFMLFIIYWIIYDSMRVFPNYLFNSVRIMEPYTIEKTLFGITSSQGILSPNEYFASNSSSFLDVLSGFFYINWVPIPLLFALYLFFKNKTLLVHFFGAFLIVNLIGFVFYYIYPAAPPWYLEKYGTEIIYNTPGSAAGLSRFDEFFNINLFHSLYEKNSNVFAAMPSLHAAYPIIVLMYGIRQKLRIGIIIFALFLIGIWFSAVYSGHHYVIDLLAGALCAFLGITLYEKIINKNKIINNWIENYSKKI